MKLRNALLAVPFALAVGCGGSSSMSAIDAAAPTYAALSIDQESSDTSAAALGEGTAQAALTAPVIAGETCHPHLFIRQREVVERLNRHVYKALRHVEMVMAHNPLTSTDSTKVWEDTRGGVTRRFTISLVSPEVYTWKLEIGADASALDVAMTGQIDRTGATSPHEGKGELHIDFAKLHQGFPSERVAQGSIDVQFDVASAARKLTVTAAGVAWDLDPGKFDSSYVLNALSAPRSGSYVYDREPGKGGSLKIKDQMVFACPANASYLPADAQLVSRWYRLADGSVHGRSDALMQNGQLPAAGVDHVVGVTCHQASAEGRVQSEGFWLMKAEDASGATITGASSGTSSDASATACDTVFGAVPTLADAASDFTGWPSAYDDGEPFTFPGM